MQRQQGLTMISWLLIFMVMGFFIMLGLRMGPIYMQNYMVKNIMQELQQEPLISRKPLIEIRKMLQRRFDINGIENLKREHIKISRAGGETTVAVVYEVRQPIVGNVDVVVSFNETLELIAN
jgi:hypothetical protein